MTRLLRKLLRWLERSQRRAHAQNLGAYIAGKLDGVKEERQRQEVFESWPALEPMDSDEQMAGWNAVNRGEAGKDVD